MLGHRRSSRPRSTPSAIGARSERSRGHGRGRRVSRSQQSLTEYLAVRRALGFKLENVEPLLGQFLAYLQADGEEQITTERALAWATLPPADALAFPAATGGPRFRRLPARGRPRGAGAAGRSLAAAKASRDALPLQRRADRCTDRCGDEPATPHRVATWQTLIGLFAATGMRIGEAIGLDRHDFDRMHGVLVVRGKFGKTRELALHHSTVRRCADTCGAATVQPHRQRTCAVSLDLRQTTRHPRRGEDFRAAAPPRGIQPRSGSAARPCTACATPSRCAPCSTPTARRGVESQWWRSRPTWGN